MKILPIGALCLVAALSGCGMLPATKPPPLAGPVRSAGRTGLAAVPRTADRSREAVPASADEDDGDGGGARGSWLSRNAWWAATKRQFERMQREIRADLDFHETEGLEGFGPDAVDQVKLMRSEMNGSGLIVP